MEGPSDSVYSVGDTSDASHACTDTNLRAANSSFKSPYPKSTPSNLLRSASVLRSTTPMSPTTIAEPCVWVCCALRNGSLPTRLPMC